VPSSPDSPLRPADGDRADSGALRRGGPVLGWRVWRVVLLAGRLRLWSAVYDEEWTPGEPFAAECRKGHAHAAPEPGCSCGVYALRSPDGLRRYLVGRDDPWVVGRVLGEVEVWGDVIEGELGWRAAYARPRRIFAGRHGQTGHLARRAPRREDSAVEPWEPSDDFSRIMIALMNIDSAVEEVAENVVAIRSLLEDDDEEEEEEDLPEP